MTEPSPAGIAAFPDQPLGGGNVFVPSLERAAFDKGREYERSIMQDVYEQAFTKARELGRADRLTITREALLKGLRELRIVKGSPGNVDIADAILAILTEAGKPVVNVEELFRVIDKGVGYALDDRIARSTKAAVIAATVADLTAPDGPLQAQ